jgi:hypothetical protein
MAMSGCGSSAGGAGGPPPAVPEGVRFEANPSLDHVTIRWTVPPTPPEYDVEWRPAGGEWRSLGRHRPTAAGVWAAFEMPRDVPVGTPLRARVRAVSGDSVSAWSEEAIGARPLASFETGAYPPATSWNTTLVIQGWVSALALEEPMLVLATGDLPIALMGPLPRGVPLYGTFEWDTTDYPMGTHVLSLRRSDGYPSPDLYVAGTPIQVERKLRLEWDLAPSSGVVHLREGSVTFRPSQGPYPEVRPPTLVRIWAGSYLVAELTGPPPWTAVTWNTAGIPEGTYPIRAEVPNYLPDDPGQGGRTSWTPFDVHVDRTPPRVTCAPPTLGAAAGWMRGVVPVEASEPVEGSMELLVNGKVYWPSFDYPSVIDPLHWGFSLDVQDVPPFRVEASRTWYADLAGNPAIVDCAFDVPAWIAPLGEGPIAAGGETVHASSADVVVSTLGGSVPRVVAAWIGKGGAQDGAAVVSASPDGVLRGRQVISTDGRTATSASVSVRPGGGSLLDDRPWVAWTEAGGGSQGDLGLVSWDGSRFAAMAAPGLRTSGRAVRDVVLRQDQMVEAEAAAVMMEEVSAGAWSVRGRRLAGGAWSDVGGAPGASPGATTGSPSLDTTPWGSTMTGMPSLLVAYLETPPGGVPQVRVTNAYPGTGWAPLAGAANRDPAVAASEPVAVYDVEMGVAWVEDGQVLARATDVLHYMYDGGFGPVSVLNRDPARRARFPRASYGRGSREPITFLFVEEGPSGDEIWARRWNGTTWNLLSGPINAGVPGTVTSLSVRDGTIAWTDGEGRLFVRYQND